MTDIEIRALSLVGDSIHATTSSGADPLTQDDSDDSDHTDIDDRPTASTSGVTQPSPDFTTYRDEEDEEEQEEEEPLILQPMGVEVGMETEEDTPVPCGPAGTSSTTESVFRGFPHGSSDCAGPSRAQQRTPSVAAPLPQQRRMVQERSVAVGVYLNVVRLSQASVDIGGELFKTMTMITANIAALSERQSEDMSCLITAMEPALSKPCGNRRDRDMARNPPVP
uniref:uncharacterized protein n=1 Tax=Pristiophorus japonicus TaxID=55135 RepID=UPI00398EC97E